MIRLRSLIPRGDILKDNDNCSGEGISKSVVARLVRLLALQVVMPVGGSRVGRSTCHPTAFYILLPPNNACWRVTIFINFERVMVPLKC